MANWQVLTQSPIAADIQNVIDAVNGIISTIADVLQLVVAALEILKALALASLNLLKAIVSAVLALIEELIFDLLEYNVGLAFHVNMNWNPFWVYNKEKERDPRTGKLDPRLIDFATDGQLPWAGTGLVGWLLDILASSKDPTDPFRPVTDSNTEVYGIMIIKGFANPAEVEFSLGIQDWINLFTNWDQFKLDPSQARVGPYVESITKLATGAAVDSLLPFFGLGPKEAQFLSIKEAVGGDSLKDYVSQFAPVPGNYPKWISVPMAAAIPPLQNLFSNLQRLLGILAPADDLSDGLSRLIRAIQDKLALLQEALQEVQDVLNFLAAIVAFLTDSYILVTKVPSGGMDTFVSSAIAAPGAPDLGTAGIVLGITMIATQPDSQATVDKFLELIGIQTSAYQSEVSVYAEALSDTFDELYP
jgi:hypothetical protein